ncbi:hypothetical protein [Rhodopseudomonas pseudopalustris]|uniref:hypothetical protein n=1 Tax=Rhodopseudomonas pseudopalustris TaxID=1513892 RepID=UPI0011145BA0|nr:hypothetical protein [Rhodopseudomonas pseudopalustris]
MSSMFAGNAQDEVNSARLAAVNGERTRQQALDTEAAGINSGALARYAGFDTQMVDRAKKLSDMFRSAVGGGEVTPGTALPASSSDVVNREIGNRQEIARMFGLQQGEARGNLQAFGDLLGTISRGQARDAGAIGQIGGYKKGSAGVQALELDAAGHAGDQNKGLADLLAGLGKVGLTAGLSGTFAPLAPAAATAGAQSGVFASGASPFLTYGH